MLLWEVYSLPIHLISLILNEPPFLVPAFVASMVPYTFKSRSVNPFVLFICPTAMLSVLVSLAALSSTSLGQNLTLYQSTDMSTNNESSHTRLGKSPFSVALQSGYSRHSSFHSRL